jgi:hypothetical protein
MLVMKWLDNKDSVSKEDLIENERDAAYLAAAADADAADADAYAYAAADAAADAAYAYAAYAAYAYAAYAAYWVNKYFIETGEDKNEYLKELSK